MYYPNDIEDICYEMEHINKVLEEIRINIPDYFQRYLDTEGGETVTEEEVARLAKALGASGSPKSKNKNYKQILEHIQKKALQILKATEKGI